MDGTTTYNNHYPIRPMYDFPFMSTEWSPVVPNIYTAPTMQCGVISPVFCPYTGVLVSETSLPVVPTPVLSNNTYSHAYEPEFNCPEKSLSTEALSDEVRYNIEEDIKVDESKVKEKCMNTTEMYLKLPKEIFPSPKMLSIDPNPIIDEFCKLSSIGENFWWILDLEFGVPRLPVTRAIAAYNVKFNSIHCKNTPGAIHPGFEKCDGDFKRVILFYYDCIVSNWYNGYITLNYDKSVENFQAWLQIPMQNFGMCWP